MNQWLQDMSWEEAKKAIQNAGKVAILPVGSVEQHGCHMPLGTDSYVAITLAEDAAKEAGALIVPPLWFGWSPHHMVRPGTITIRPEILSEITFDIAASLSHHGIRKLIMINGHRIVNVVWMQLAAEKIQRELDMAVKIFDPAYMSKEIVKDLGFGAVGHAEEIETSHMMYRYPDLVNLALAKDNPVKDAHLYSVDPSYEKDTLCYVPSTYAHAEKNAEIAGGTSGEPTKADAQKGKSYHEHLVKRLVEVIETLRER
ncbi:MAG: creatininase family protein [Dorea sp.]|nr:creatininase family protein [Dorea sp.]